MIYAMYQKDLPLPERKKLACQIAEQQNDRLNSNKKVAHVLDPTVGDRPLYCIYCAKKVSKWSRTGTFMYHHEISKGCIGSDSGPTDYLNPKSVTATLP